MFKIFMMISTQISMIISTQISMKISAENSVDQFAENEISCCQKGNESSACQLSGCFIKLLRSKCFIMPDSTLKSESVKLSV